MQQQADDLVRGEVIAAPVHPAHPIGIAIRHQTDIVRMLFQISLAPRVILFNRFGVDAAEQDVVGAIERGDLAGGAGQQLLKAARAHTKQGVMRKTQLRFRNQVEIHEFFKRRVMRRTDVDTTDQARLDRIDKRQGPDGVTVQPAFDSTAGGRIAGASVRGFELVAVEAGRVVAGSDHHPAHGAPLFDGKRDRGRGRGLRRQNDLKTIAGKDLRSDLGEAVGKESAVIADHHPGRPPKNRRRPIPDLRFPKAGGGLRDPGDIGEGELLRNDRAPAVGAEVDACHFWRVTKNSCFQPEF